MKFFLTFVKFQRLFKVSEKQPVDLSFQSVFSTLGSFGKDLKKLKLADLTVKAISID